MLDHTISNTRSLTFDVNGDIAAGFFHVSKFDEDVAIIIKWGHLKRCTDLHIYRKPIKNILQ
jgi:hypothetical protein